MQARCFAAASSAVLFAFSSLAGTLALDWSTDKEPVSYLPKDTMTFQVLLVEDGKPVGGKKLKWLRTGDDGLTDKGEAATSEAKPVSITATTDKPGFVRLEVSVFNADGSPAKDAKGAAVKFEGGAGVQPEKLEGYPEPADFDAFWQKQKARLAAVPLKADLKEVPAKKPGFKVYDVKIDCAGGKPVSGYLSIPEGAAAKSLAAQVNFHGYGVGGANQASWPGMIVFDINAHGIENGREPEYYEALKNGALKGYAFNSGENAKPETAYFNGMMLRLLRALEYVKARPEWDGKKLIAAGGSQGGLQAITAAALDSDVTQCSAYKPWCCDLGGVKLQRLRGWRPDWADGLGYYDTATMGKRIKCPTTISAGLGDYVCPPSGVSILYNNIKGPKSIEYVQGSTHGYNPPNPKKQMLKAGHEK
jgi:cephalosporin-C deacetylase-like acetyl esterase